VTEFARARNRSRNRSNVGVSLTANIVGTILKQAGLSESVLTYRPNANSSGTRRA